MEICRKYTDKIHRHSFENQAKQFNWALDNVPISNKWIMRLDSDEMITPELTEEICELFGVKNGVLDKKRDIGLSNDVTGR